MKTCREQWWEGSSPAQQHELAYCLSPLQPKLVAPPVKFLVALSGRRGGSGGCAWSRTCLRASCSFGHRSSALQLAPAEAFPEVTAPVGAHLGV